jgi:hypothetical protein
MLVGFIMFLGVLAFFFVGYHLGYTTVDNELSLNPGVLTLVAITALGNFVIGAIRMDTPIPLEGLVDMTMLLLAYLLGLGTRWIAHRKHH